MLKNIDFNIVSNVSILFLTIYIYILKKSMKDSVISFNSLSFWILKL